MRARALGSRASPFPVRTGIAAAPGRASLIANSCLVGVGLARSTPCAIHIAVASIAVRRPELKLVSEELPIGVAIADYVAVGAVFTGCTRVPALKETTLVLCTRQQGGNVSEGY